LEVINSIQKRILQSFGGVSDSNQFYLTGGTALAHFYLQHRKSNDLDFFTSLEEIVTPFSYRLEEKLKAEGISVERQRGAHSFIELWVKQKEETTLIHLAQDAAFRFEPSKEFPGYPGLKVDGLVDIASNKLLALFGRATLRDFIDVYFLVKKAGFSREDLMAKAAEKDPGFDLYWLGVAFERIKTFNQDSADMLMLINRIDFRELLSFFEAWRKEIAQKLKS